ncbi:MAG: hypothetical protein ABSB79_06565 [Syntrophales bacterium]
MMSEQQYPVRNALLVPFTLVVVLLLILLLMAVFGKYSFAEQIFYFAAFVPALYVFLETASRKVITDERGMTIRKFLRRKAFSWEDITHVGCVIMGKKVYLLITTLKGFFIVSNAVDRLSVLIQELLDHLGEEKMEEEARNLIANPISKMSDIFGLWIAALAMSGIIIYKVFIL